MLENLLMFIGLISLGATTGGIGLTVIGLVTVFRNPPGQQPSMNWGAYYGAVISLACGGMFGALVGLSLAVGWISHRDDRPWSIAVWLGIVMGLLAGGATVLIGFLEILPEGLRILLTFWPTAMLIASSFATAGGLLGSLIPVGVKDRTHRR